MSDPGSHPDPANENPSDCFAPPKESCECYCLHCNRVFMSDGIWFQKVVNSHDGFDGFWMCPTPNCDGAGFTFDIFPTDPDHPANGGWTYDDGDDADDEETEISTDTEPAGEYDPDEPAYAEFEEEFAEDDDIEGEEWKHGLAPGERPPEPPWVEQARLEWEKEQERYNGPDERPRVVDWSDRPPPATRPPRADGEIDENDIPF